MRIFTRFRFDAEVMSNSPSTDNEVREPDRDWGGARKHEVHIYIQNLFLRTMPDKRDIL